ncbi:unnamed protein product [Periconia digitata]|uniref:Monopolin complex subunit Csm1/Pcs1 C-terminal domain-containing protein n=1 Tax=Periconia digitata TaxID=1303443 RepID=A0A9W4UKU4_9PLEO|nr:unnamed protein product [Periconia digitata]
MAPRSTAVNVSFTVDSASEDETRDELDIFPTPDSNTENKVPARKPRGKVAQTAKSAPAIKATAKTRTTARRTSGSGASGVKKQGAGAAKKTSAKAGRKALAEKEVSNGNDTEEVDEFDAQEEVVAPAPVKATRRGRPPKAKVEEEEVEALPPTRRTRKTAEKEIAPKPTKAKSAAKTRVTKRTAAVDPVPEDLTIPETQQEPEPDPMDVDIEQSIELDEVPETMPPPPPPRPSARRIQQEAKTARQASAGPRRAGSASDTERDPALRRKVGDLTKKLEAMTARYDTLKDVAGATKESNFDQLKKKTDQISKDQDAVIKALKQQLAEVQSRSADMLSLKKDMAKLEKENARLNAENKKLTDSLASSQGENKTLSTKLAAARSSAPPDSKNIPGSAVKPRTTGVVLPGAAEAAKETQFQKQKVDLYSDLTNLIVLGCKKNEDDEEVYDCLQAGRNGTLHFQLTVTDNGDSYEDTEIWYTPLLDEKRDQDLIELLPDYLTDEISFPRAQAPKFYTKVVECMGKKIELVDQE